MCGDKKRQKFAVKIKEMLDMLQNLIVYNIIFSQV